MTSVSSATNKVYEGAPKLDLKPIQPEKLAANLEMVVTQTAVVEKDSSHINRAINNAAATYGPRKLGGKSTTISEEAKEEDSASVFTPADNKPRTIAAEQLTIKSFTSIKTPEPRPTKQMIA